MPRLLRLLLVAALVSLTPLLMAVSSPSAAEPPCPAGGCGDAPGFPADDEPAEGDREGADEDTADEDILREDRDAGKEGKHSDKVKREPSEFPPEVVAEVVIAQPEPPPVDLPPVVDAPPPSSAAAPAQAPRPAALVAAPAAPTARTAVRNTVAHAAVNPSAVPAPVITFAEAPTIAEGGVAVPPPPSGAYVSADPPSPAHRAAPLGDNGYYAMASPPAGPFSPSAIGSWIIVGILGTILISVARSAAARDAEAEAAGSSPPARPVRGRTSGIRPRREDG